MENRQRRKGGIGSASNLIAHAVVAQLNSMLDVNLQAQIASTQTNEYKGLIKEEIMQQSPRMGNAAANKAANKTIKEIQGLLRKGNADLKVILKQTVGNGLEYLKTQIK